MQLFLPHLRREDEGHIVNLSSMFGFVGFPGQSSYCATKFAVRGFSEARGRAFAATVYGKVKMFIQSATIVAILISVAHYQHAEWARYVRLAFIWPMVIFTVVSMLGYISRYTVLKDDTDA